MDPRMEDAAILQRTQLPSPRASGMGRMRAWLRSRTGRGVLLVVTFLVGAGCGVVAIVLYALTISTEGQVISLPLVPSESDIVVQVGRVYITHLVDRTVRDSGLPGNITNVQVSMVHGDQMTITGDDQLSLLGISVSRHFTLVVQPTVNACQLQVHVLHADMGGIVVTGFVATFESMIDQRLLSKAGSLPSGFVYCKTSVRTEPEGLLITFSAVPG